jgi:hypothetical protein
MLTMLHPKTVLHPQLKNLNTGINHVLLVGFQVKDIPQLEITIPG